MAIQVRRGNEADFDASKMLPGEWAVSLDTKYVRMCFAPGIVLRMASYESFEADMELIQGILEECEEIQTAIERIKSEIDEKASLTIEYSNSASLSATRASEEADRAHEEAERAKNYADSAQSATNVQIATKDTAGIIKGGDNYIAEDGTLTLIVEITETTMPNSCEGRLWFKEIRGKTEQNGIPTPANPQEIKSVSISGIKTYRKNMLNCQGLTKQTFRGVTFTPNYDANGNLLYIEVNGTASEGVSTYSIGTFKFDSNKPCILSGCPSGGSDSKYTIYTENPAVGTDYGNGVTITSDFSADIRIGIANGVTVDKLRFYPMIRKADDTDATYEPYSASSFTFSKPIELHGIGDVQDVIVDDKLIRKFGVRIFNGSEIWILATGQENSNTFHCEVPDAKRSKTTQNGLCDTYNFVDTDQRYLENNECTMYHDITDSYLSSNWIYIRDTTCTTNSEFKAKLQANPITVVYELESETTEALPTADQIALNSLATYDGITYLEFDSEIEPTFKGEYGTSKVGGYTLEGMLAGVNGELLAKSNSERINALEASVVNNI